MPYGAADRPPLAQRLEAELADDGVRVCDSFARDGIDGGLI
jgi:hypothetical protein